MFMSLKYSFSVQTIAANGDKMPWSPIVDEAALLDYLAGCSEDIFRVAGQDYLGRVIMITHKYCKKMIRGFESFGKGLKI